MSRRARTTVIVAGAAALVLLAIALATGGNDDETGGSAAQGELQMLDGGTDSFDSYRGQPLVVNFFASWCVPCLAEMPAFEQVHQDLDGKVAFLGINLQDDIDDGRAIIEETGVTYDIARDPDGTLFTDFGGTSMPTTVLVDADGQVVEVISGAIPGGALSAKIDDELLG